MFAIIAIPFDAYRQLPSPQHRWLLTCLSRYADKAGRCWPNMRQLADDARMSLSTVCRRLREMDELAVFHRERQGRGRYVYTLAEAYRPRWPGKENRGVSGAELRVPHREKQKSNHNQVKKSAHDDGLQEGWSPWKPRMRGWLKSQFWLPLWGPRPDEQGCFVPAGLLRSQLGEDRGHAS